MRPRFFIAAVIMLLAIAAQAFALGPEDVPRVTAKGLKAKLDGGERIVVLDVRSRGAYDSSKVKIKGAVRIAPDELKDRAWELPMGGIIVTYCT